MTLRPPSRSGPVMGIWEFPSGQSTTPSVWGPANQYVDGGMISCVWSHENPSPGTYNWTRLDNLAAAWKNAGKKYGIRVTPFSGWTGWFGSPQAVPAWILDSAGPVMNLNGGAPPAGVATGPAYDGTANGGCRWIFDADSSIVPIPWDLAFLANLATFLTALAARYGPDYPKYLQWVGMALYGGETNLTPNRQSYPAQTPTATLNSGGTLTVGTAQFYKAFPLYGSGGGNNPPQMADVASATQVTATPTTGNQQITVAWTAPALTFAQMPITGYQVWRGTVNNKENQFITVSAATFSLVDTGGLTWTAGTLPTNTLQGSAWNVAGYAGPNALMGNAEFNANSGQNDLWARTLVGIWTRTKAAFGTCPIVASVVDTQPSGQSGITTLVPYMIANGIWYQNDSIVPDLSGTTFPATMSLMSSSTYGLWEEKTSLAQGNYAGLVSEVQLGNQWDCRAYLIYAVEINWSTPGSPTYDPNWDTAMQQAAPIARSVTNWTAPPSLTGLIAPPVIPPKTFATPLPVTLT